MIAARSKDYSIKPLLPPPLHLFRFLLPVPFAPPIPVFFAFERCAPGGLVDRFSSVTRGSRRFLLLLIRHRILRPSAEAANFYTILWLLFSPPGGHSVYLLCSWDVRTPGSQGIEIPIARFRMDSGFFYYLYFHGISNSWLSPGPGTGKPIPKSSVYVQSEAGNCSP